MGRVLIAVGLSMDAVGVSGCKGRSVRKATAKHALCGGLYFGGFQALMPLIGYFLGSQFESLVTAIAPYIAFALLAFIGANMIRESRSGDEDAANDDFSVRSMIPLAIAKSIDALAVGVSFAFLQVDIVPAVVFIGVTTFVCCVIGVKVGSLFGNKYQARAELFGGVVLILMGVKILLEHLLG